MLYDRLRVGPKPAYTHLPLIVGPDGRRLAKRHGDSRISRYREQGVSARRVIGLLARCSGFSDAAEMSAAEFCEAFRLEHLPRTSIMFRPEDEAWLCSLNARP
jgi:glutamyl-tRNA synthetase